LNSAFPATELDGVPDGYSAMNARDAIKVMSRF
jgi:hypothetical protein